MLFRSSHVGDNAIKIIIYLFIIKESSILHKNGYKVCRYVDVHTKNAVNVVNR